MQQQRCGQGGWELDRFVNSLKGHAAALDRMQGQARFAVVSSVDARRYSARVRLQPEDVLSGWLPILSPWVGAGWGFVALPAPGDQVLVVAQEGDADSGVILGASFSAPMPPPGCVGCVKRPWPTPPAPSWTALWPLFGACDHA